VKYTNKFSEENGESKAMSHRLVIYSLIAVSIFFLQSASALQVYQDEIPTAESNLSVNNSQYLQGYTPVTLRSWMQVTYNTLYCELVGCTMTGDINLGYNDITNVNNINATSGNFTDLYVSNSTLYIGDNIKLSATNGAESVLNITGGNLSAGYYYGSGEFLTDLNLTGISFDGDTINATQFNGGGFYGNFINLQKNIPDPLTPMINVGNIHPNGTSLIRLENDLGSQVSLGIYGSEISRLLFGEQLGENVSGAMGISNRGGPLAFATRDNESIYFGGSPNDNLADAKFSVKIDTLLDAIILQGNKYIRPVRVDGGYAMVFQSLEVLSAGGFPFVWVAQDSNNDTIVPIWTQNGRNNSFSGQMNSFGLVPKSWVSFEGEPVGNESQGMEFLFNVSDYIYYCNYLKNNLSLVPEGCKYFADTTSRKVPLLFTGDLEVHRTATIHEGINSFGKFTHTSRELSHFDIIAPVHIRQNKTEQIGYGSGEYQELIWKDFEDWELSPWTQTTSGGGNREWQTTDDSDCHDNVCVRSSGGGIRSMQVNLSTENIGSLNISFWLTTNSLDVNDDFTLTIDNNEGNSEIIYQITNGVDVNDVFIDTTSSIPSTMENKSIISLTFTLNAGSVFENVNMDDFLMHGITTGDTLQNVTRWDGMIRLGNGEESTFNQGIYYNASTGIMNLKSNITNIQDVMSLEPISIAPSNPNLGYMYVDSDSNELCFYDGSSWTGIKAGGVCA